MDIFFALLRSGLYGTPIPPSDLPEKIDWNAIVAIARKHFVFGTIIDAIQYLPEHLHPSARSVARMNQFALGLIQTNVVLDRTAARLVTFLEAHDIRGVLLKGQGVARYYRQPQMRQRGDIDFYVGRKLYKEACRLCSEKLAEEGEHNGETEQHFSFTLDGVTVELHRIASRIYTPVRNRRFQHWVAEQLEHSPERRTLTVGDTDITLPPYEFDAIFIFYHAWRHYITGGIGLRQLCDWAMIFYSHSDNIDRKRLVENLRRFGMTKGWKLFACIAVKYLGVPADKIPLYDPGYMPRAEKILEEIVEGGNFGYYAKDFVPNRGKLYGLRYNLRKFKAITDYFFTLFPLIPVEGTFLFLNRLYRGTIDTTRRSLHRMRNEE